MNSPATRRLIVLSTLILSSVCLSAEDRLLWFQQRVTWSLARDEHPWETIVTKPGGQERYRLALVPLWSVEGGVVAMEIVLARAERPEESLLGQRKQHVPQRFVITVDDLAHGITRSRFGAVRKFRTNEVELVVKIQGCRLGKGVGSGSVYCDDCRNIQEITAQMSLGPR